jgi:predicted polyphosphate/ATP-dependent NAD kinase
MLCSNLMSCFGSRVVLDVHEEALRIKQLKAAEAGSSSTPAAEASSSTSAAAEVAEEIPGYSVGAGSTAVPEKSIK